MGWEEMEAREMAGDYMDEVTAERDEALRLLKLVVSDGHPPMSAEALKAAIHAFLANAGPRCEEYRRGYQCRKRAGHDGPHEAMTLQDTPFNWVTSPPAPTSPSPPVPREP